MRKERELSSPRISVIVPLYNGESYIAEALDSVLGQSLRPHEVIVVDDGSAEDSLQALGSYKDHITLLSQKNSGTAAARNAGIHASTGDLIAFLDQDDYWSLDKLAQQVGIISDHPCVDAAWGLVQQFFSPELPDTFKDRYRCPKEPVAGYLPSALLIKREAFFKVGLFNTRWRIGEWADWYARFTQSGISGMMVPEVVAYRRIHEGNKGITMVEDRKEYLSLIRDNLKRKKANG